MKIELVNDHPYAHLTEYGWGDYDVYPLGKENGGANALKIPTKGGKFYFSKHTHPRGFKGYNILESLENWGFYERFLEKIIDGANKWLQEARMR